MQGGDGVGPERVGADATSVAAAIGVPGVEHLTEIGRGGFGIVYQAWQPEFRRWVAVKLVTAPPDERVASRFERERWTIGALTGHPNIVTVFTAGESSYGLPYIVMEFLPGGALSDRLPLHPYPCDEAVTVMVRVANAVQAAHEAGVLHRDIKPENILLSAHGEPKLGDFGIARLDGVTETTTGIVTASIAHAAPELLNGDKPTVQSDVYALGSTLYTLIAGTPAFLRVDDPSLIPVLARIARDPVPDLNHFGVSEELQHALARSMAKDPAERFSTAAEFASAVSTAPVPRVTSHERPTPSSREGAVPPVESVETPEPDRSESPTVDLPTTAAEPESPTAELETQTLKVDPPSRASRPPMVPAGPPSSPPEAAATVALGDPTAVLSPQEQPLLSSASGPSVRRIESDHDASEAFLHRLERARVAEKAQGPDGKRVAIVGGGIAIVVVLLIAGVLLVAQRRTSSSESPAPSPVAAGVNDPSDVAVHSDGTLFVVNRGDGRLLRIGTDRKVTTVATGLSDASSVTVSPTGVAYVGSVADSTVRSVKPDGIVAVVAGTGARGWNGDGNPPLQTALALPRGVGVDSAGNVLIADTDNNRVRRLVPGTESTSPMVTVAGKKWPPDGIGPTGGFSGDGGPATAAELNQPSAVTGGPDGSVVLFDRDNARIRKVTNGIIDTVAGAKGGKPMWAGAPALETDLAGVEDIAVDGSGTLYLALGGVIYRLGQDGRLVQLAKVTSSDKSTTKLPDVAGIAVDNTGAIFVAERSENRILRVSPAGEVTTVVLT